MYVPGWVGMFRCCQTAVKTKKPSKMEAFSIATVGEWSRFATPWWVILLLPDTDPVLA